MDMEQIESCHEYETDHEEYTLSYACIHRAQVDISAVVNFFEKVYKRNQNADSYEKYPGSEEDKWEHRIRDGIHVEPEECHGNGAAHEYDEENKKIRSYGHIFDKSEQLVYHSSDRYIIAFF